MLTWAAALTATAALLGAEKNGKLYDFAKPIRSMRMLLQYGRQMLVKQIVQCTHIVASMLTCLTYTAHINDNQPNVSADVLQLGVGLG